MAGYYEKLLQNRNELTKNDYAMLAFAIALPVAQGFLSSHLGTLDEWYKKLKMPWFTPPNWVFPIMWTTLYILMGISSWRIWRNGGFEKQAVPLGLYAVQLVLNFLWSPIFFRFHAMGVALFEIVLLWASIAVCIFVFYPVDKIASYLLIPYISWVSVATALNYSLWTQNPDIKAD